jgi:preprotein translocase subunit YajC
MEAEQKTSAVHWIVQFFPFIVIFIVMFYMMGSSSRKDKKKKEELMNTLKKDDKIQTIGGIIGTVDEVMANEVRIIIDPTNKTSMTFAKASISTIVKPEQK